MGHLRLGCHTYWHMQDLRLGACLIAKFGDSFAGLLLLWVSVRARMHVSQLHYAAHQLTSATTWCESCKA